MILWSTVLISSKKTLTFFTFTKFLQMLIDFHNIWHTVYWSNLQQLLTCLPHLRRLQLLHYLEKYHFLVLGPFWLICSINKAINETWWNLTNERFLLLHTTMTLSWMLVQEKLRPLVPLLWRWHLPARQCASTLMCASDNWVTAAWNSQVNWSGVMTSI